MEVKPTWFSITGFFVPGVVLVTAMTSLTMWHEYRSVSAIVAAIPKLPENSGFAVLIAASIGVALLVLSFAVGAVLSDAFIFIGRRLVLRPLMRPALRRNVTRLFRHRSLRTLVRLDMDAREVFVYSRTCGLDLHWYAGRVRMVGASGTALLISGVAAWLMSFPCFVGTSLLSCGAIAFVLALYRSNKFDEYIAAAAAVLAFSGDIAPPRGEPE